MIKEFRGECAWLSNFASVPITLECLGQKFIQNPYKRLLICTGDEHIQEGNNWNDRF